MNVIVWLLLVWFAVTGAAGSVTEPTEPLEPPPVPPATIAPHADPYPAGLEVDDSDGAIEQRFLTRAPVPTCGLMETDRQDLWGDPPPAYDVECLQQALEAGEGAESVVLMGSGGDRVMVYYRLNPGGPLEILGDLRADPGADRAWRYRVCAPPADLRAGPCRS